MGKKIQVAKKQVRSVEALDVKTDSENQTLEFSFSSEVPYKRWYGFEIISHEKGAMNLERLKAAAPLLFNHDWDQHLGVVEDAWIGDDKRGYVRVKFSKSAFAQEKFQDIQDGILKGVSFGYMIEEMKLTKTSDDGDDEYTVTKSFPYEITLCTVPADYSVGVGRSADAENEGEKLDIEAEFNVPEDKTRSLEDNQPAAIPAPTKEITMSDHAEAVKAERERIAAIRALGSKFKQEDLATSLIDSGASLGDAKGAFLEKMGIEQKPVTGNEAVVGLNEKELGKYSFVRAIYAMMNPNDQRAQEAAKFEREVSLAAAEKGGKAARGFMVPVDVLRHSQRDLLVGTTTAGGHLVSTDLQSGSFIELLRKKSVVQRAGAQVLNGLVGNIAIPRQTGGATAYWVGENVDVTESQQAFDQVAMGPKTIGAFTDFSRRLMLQSSIDVENMVKNDLATVLALGIDLAALYGTGGSQPTGLKSITGVNTVDLTAYATPTFAEIVGMETAIASDNADVANMKYLINAVGRGNMKVTPKVAGQAQFLLENGLINGYGYEVSNQIAAGDIWFGNFAELILGFWSGLDLMIDPITGSKAGTVRVLAHQDVDVAARHGESFCLGYEIA